MELVYLDSSVALAHLLAEDVRPPDRMWDESLVASHVASVLFLMEQGQRVELATYDHRMREVASALEIPLYGLESQPLQ